MARRRMKYVFLVMLIAAFSAGALVGCDSTNGDLAPYEGERPLNLLKITQSFSPDIQWVGGRVAAVGVNRGDIAALDSSLVWLIAADEDEINSHVTVGQGTDASRIKSFGGVPVDSLPSGEKYTFWLATKEVMDAALQSGSRNEFTFLDTTFSLGYELRGRLRTRERVSVAAFRDQKLISDRLVIRWEPADFEFRRIALRQASSPGFEDLVWHIQTPDDESPNLTSPLATDDPPEGVRILEPWPEDGLTAGASYTLWMTTDSWNNTFGLTAPGLAYIQFFSSSVQP